MKKLLVLVLTVFSMNQLLAQETETKPKTPIGGRPNIPSDLNFEFGFNALTNRPEDLSTKFFGSRTFNISYQVPINLFGDASGFTLNPGIGIGSDKLEFADAQNLFSVGTDGSKLDEVSDVYGSGLILKKNNFAANYFEVPIDIRYHFSKNNYSKSFKISIGGKVGYLYEAHTKIKFETSDSGAEKIKTSHNFGLEKFRYALTFKAGSPGFYVWSNFYLNDMWKANKGPYNAQASQINFGVAVTVF